MECAPSEILQAEICGQYFTFSCRSQIACAVIENRLGGVAPLFVGPIRKILGSECPHRNRLRLHPVHHRCRVIIILAPFLPVRCHDIRHLRSPASRNRTRRHRNFQPRSDIRKRNRRRSRPHIRHRHRIPALAALIEIPQFDFCFF